jgi:hypothetical protein
VNMQRRIWNLSWVKRYCFALKLYSAYQADHSTVTVWMKGLQIQYWKQVQPHP